MRTWRLLITIIWNFISNVMFCTEIHLQPYFVYGNLLRFSFTHEKNPKYLDFSLVPPSCLWMYVRAFPILMLFCTISLPKSSQTAWIHAPLSSRDTSPLTTGTHRHFNRWNSNDPCEYSLVSIWTFSFCLVVFCAIVVCRVIKGPISSPDGSASSLIIEMPIETYERLVLIAFMLQKRKTLLDSELFQIPTKTFSQNSCLISLRFCALLALLTCNDLVSPFALVVLRQDSF
jgi:hypothetical protein